MCTAAHGPLPGTQGAGQSVGGVRVGRRSVCRIGTTVCVSVHVSRVAHPDQCYSLRGLCESLCDSQHCIAADFGESGLLENEPTAPAEQAHTTQRQ